MLPAHEAPRHPPLRPVCVLAPRLGPDRSRAAGSLGPGGGVDLLDVTWNEGTRSLSGRSRVIGGDPYEVYVTVPPGFEFQKAECEGADAGAAFRDGAQVRFTCRRASTREIGWAATFERR